MRRERRRPAPPPMVPDSQDAPPSHWERGFIYLEFFGFGVLIVSGMVVTFWGAFRYLEGWS
ncbi:hypothetical protein ACH37Y_06465 [Sphingomonas paucimobilis]|uniref:hypothetical protein n=1 Tax=Sphingomonas paucimobilis TaxID=13689 RepID=UPI0037898FD6